MALSEAGTLQDRFTSARLVLDTTVPRRRRVGRTYQGFIKALLNLSDSLLLQVQDRLRDCIRAVSGSHWTRFGWVIIAADGSKIDCVRTAANEEAFGIGGRKKSGPQQLLTTLWHMGTGLPWAWICGRADESERDHLRRMLSLLPAACLVVADAGFTGFHLLHQLQKEGMFFLIRVGANVTLLRNLGYAVQQRGDLVYLWPLDCRKYKPLVLRLIQVVSPGGKRPVFLLTNVLDEERLPGDVAAAIYRMRWGIEVFYRSLKQTLQRRKMRSAAPRQATLELHWTLIGLLLLGLVSTSAIIKRGKDPLSWSVACALQVVRQAMRQPPKTLTTLLRKLGSAIKDSYQRDSDKKARNWPHKKTESPPGQPKIRTATPDEVRKAQELMEIQA